MKKKRIDDLLVEQGLTADRKSAQALVLAGLVFSGTVRLEKAGRLLAFDTPLRIKSREHSFVSRGGVKLAGALDAWNFDPTGLVVADFGASTGGFTDCLLQRGASLVFAIDVGRGLLHEKLRQDPRVVAMERTNARHLTVDSLPQLADLVVIDASFIGSRKLLPAALAVSKSDSSVVVMVKPQFEASRNQVDCGGVVHDATLRQQLVDDVVRAARELNLVEKARVASVLPGPKGNVEIFVLLAHAATA